jgi:hypothetical protein
MNESRANFGSLLLSTKGCDWMPWDQGVENMRVLGIMALCVALGAA